MEIKKSKDQYIIKLIKGEKVIENLITFCKENNIEGAKFFGLGALKKVDISYYSLKDYEYHSKEFEGEFEVLNITGNVAMFENEQVVHAHITLGDTEYNSFGGHINEGIVSPTLEIFLTPLDRLERKFDEKTKLKLLDL